MNKSRNPKELVDRYLQDVRFWLSKTQQQEDLLAELGEDLRSQIEEKESALGRPAEEIEVSEILKRCGPPIVVAGRLAPKHHLIGPTLYPVYTFVLKMVLLWILVPVFLFIVGPVNVANSGGNWGSAIGNTIGDLWSGLFIAAGVITLVFAILERTQAYAGRACKWDPSSLPPLQKQERKTSPVHTVCELAFGFFGLIWLLLLPTYPVLILGPASRFLRAAPLSHTLFFPIVLLSVLGILRSALILAKPQWTAFPLWTQLLQSVLTLILLRFVLKAVGQSQHGDWHPFVVVAGSVQNSAHYLGIAAVVNASILISVVAAWFGLCIGIAAQTWKLLRYRRKPASSNGLPATLRVQ